MKPRWPLSREYRRCTQYFTYIAVQSHLPVRMGLLLVVDELVYYHKRAMSIFRQGHAMTFVSCAEVCH